MKSSRQRFDSPKLIVNAPLKICKRTVNISAAVLRGARGCAIIYLTVLVKLIKTDILIAEAVMDYTMLAEKMLSVRAQLSHMPAGEAVSEASGGEFYALSFLLLHGDRSSPSELSRHMGVSTARVAALLKHLEKKGFVHRLSDPRDERRVIVMLTDAGRVLIRQRRADAVERVAAALRALGEEDAREYVRLQLKLLKAIEVTADG